MREHGTHACFVHGPERGSVKGGCKCGPCRAANAAYERERSKRTAPTLVSADPVREHLAALAGAGVGLKTVAKVSGVSHGALWKLVYGVPSAGRPPTRRVRPETASAILAVTTADGAPGSRVPAGPTHRNIETLVARGWSKSAISAAIGQDGRALQIGARFVTRANAQAVAALLDQDPVTKRARNGEHIAPRWDREAERRDEARRQAERERRAAYRAAERGEEPGLPLIDPSVFDAPWRERAVCARMPEGERWVFWADQGDRAAVAAAKRVCASCPVAAECRSYAVEAGESGVWGGTTDAERRRVAA